MTTLEKRVSHEPFLGELLKTKSQSNGLLKRRTTNGNGNGNPDLQVYQKQDQETHLQQTHRDSQLLNHHTELFQKAVEETTKFDAKKQVLAQTVKTNFENANLFTKERSSQIEMAGVLLFDAINDLPTRHRLKTKFDRKIYLFIYGDFFRLYICAPVCVFNMALVYNEDYNLDMICLAFHLFHFIVRLYLRVVSDGDGVTFGDLRKTMRAVLTHRSEQFEFIGMCSAVAQIITLTKFPDVHFMWTRSLRVFYLVDCLKVLKRLTRNVVSTVVALREVFLLWVAITSFFALTAIVVWPPRETVQGAVYFKSLHRAIMTFTFATIGAVNFPDILLPTVNEESISTSFFFVLFMLIIVVWLLNLCLAVVYQQYINHVHKVSERSERALRKTRILAMDLAKWLQTATSTTKTLTRPIRIWLAWFARASFKLRLASLGAAIPPPLQDAEDRFAVRLHFAG